MLEYADQDAGREYCSACMSVKKVVGCPRKQAGSSGKQQEGSSGKRRAQEPSDPQSSGGKRQRRDSARYFDSLDEEELQEEEEEGDRPAAARHSPDENAQPGNAEAKQRTMQKPAGAELTLTDEPSCEKDNSILSV